MHEDDIHEIVVKHGFELMFVYLCTIGVKWNKLFIEKLSTATYINETHIEYLSYNKEQEYRLIFFTSRI